MAIIIPSENIYAMQNDKILDNQISGVDVEENILLNNDNNFFNFLLQCYTNKGQYTYDINAYNNNLNDNSIIPTKTDITYDSTGLKNYYAYFKTTNSIDTLSYFDYCSADIVQKGTDQVLNIGIVPIEIKKNITTNQQNPDFSIKIYNSIQAFEEETFEFVSIPPYLPQIGYIKNTSSQLKIGVVFNTDKTYSIMIVAKQYEKNDQNSYYRIQESYSISLVMKDYKIDTKSIKYGESQNLAFNSNELIQTTTKNGTKKISEYLANNIISSYENGKETAVIRCSINDYYNEDTTIAKSITDTTKDMTFRMYDNVIPMIPSPNGDVPMSKYKEGASKIFKVLGTKLINNGAVWQELTLQERFREKYIKFEIDGTGTNTISARANTTSGTTTGISSNRTMQYSLNGKDWNSWDGSALTITTSQPIYLRSNITANGGSGLYTNFFFGNSTTKIKCSGDMRYMAMTNNYAEISNTVPFTYCYSYMLYGCTSLTTAPSLPATTLDSYCYWCMFRGCTSLTTAPSLPATALATECYSSMFQYCTSLTTAPSLPATALATSCYSYMFYNCTSLTTAPSLPATTLTNACYSYMLYGCTSLTTAPSLPATALATSCYSYMLYGCTSLTTAPSLPATTLATGCYRNMFQSCTSLTTAPSLPATTLTTNCYSHMFYVCTSLTQVSININNNTTIPTDALTNMLASTGTVSQPPNAIYCDRTTIIADTNATSRWVQQPYAEQDREEYIKFEIDGTGTNTISARANTMSGTTTGISSNRTMQYSLNGKDWHNWNGSALTITTSQPIYLRSNITANGGSGLYTNFFFGNSTTKIKCSGDMRYMAMTNNYAEISNTVPFTYCYLYMFYNCTSLTTAPSLPATALATDCYYYMFVNCTSLTTAPSLPANALTTNCYSYMFRNCTSLTTAPSLPATALAYGCYLFMFESCTSLTTAPSLPATTLATSCYSSMFYNCTSLTTAPSLPATTLATDCYSYMFYNCTSLTTAPSLPATALANYCYSFMFYNCTALTTAPSLPATTLATDCYSYMFYVCTSLTQVSININNNTTIPTDALTDMLAYTGTVSQPPNAIYCDRTTIIADTNATSRWVQQPYAE